MSEPEKQLPDGVVTKAEVVKAVRRQRPIRGRVYYEERRKRVAELRAIGNLTFDQIGERITAYGFEPMTGERAWRDYQLCMKENAKALNSVERKSEIVTKLEGLFSLALMAYKDAQRQTKEGTRIPDPYAQAILLQRAVEILERLAELSGFISRKGFVVTQTVSTEQKQVTLDFRQIVNKYRLERGLAPIPLDDK
ncbi:MAG: hypothetical protein NTX17_05745 [Candidatus Eisenbacteria bacterium]|nr:hypothetical protein [Candidatus Eisenbacteria bacterium]